MKGPRNTVISGSRPAVRRVLDSLEAEGIASRKLKVSQAFHSPLVEPMLAPFEQVVAQVTCSAPRAGMVSNITGAAVGAEITSPGTG